MPFAPLRTLDDNERAVLNALVISFPGKGKGSLIKLLKAAGIADAGSKTFETLTLPALLQSLQDEGWVVIEHRREGHYFCVAPKRRNEVLLSLLTATHASHWLDTIAQSLTPIKPYQAPTTHRVLQELWLDLFTDDPERVSISLNRMIQYLPHTQLQTVHPTHLLLADEAGLEVFVHLNPDIRQVLLEDHLSLSNSRLAPADNSYALGLAEMQQRPDFDLGLQLLLQAFWRSDWKAVEYLGEFDLFLLQKTIAQMARGQVDETLQLLRGWLTDMRRKTKKRRIDLPPVLNALYCMALLAENDPGQRAALKQALTLGEKERFGHCYEVLLAFFDQLQGNKPRLSFARPTRLNGLDGLLYAIGLYWLDSPMAQTQEWRTTLFDYRDELARDGYFWLAAEFDALIGAQFSAPRQLAAVYEDGGLLPLISLHQRQESWEHALAALSQIKPARLPTVTTTDHNTTRLVWMIGHSKWHSVIEPREQKRGAKGQWTKGRPVALKRLAEEADLMDFLCEQDRQAISAIQTSRYSYSSLEYHLPTSLGLPKLVGHPNLYWHDAPDVRIDLVDGQASLRLLTERDRIHLHLEPKEIVDAEGIHLYEETPTRLQVYKISRELRQIADIVGTGLSVPQTAKAQLIDAVSAIAPLLPIHSDIPELIGHLDREPADPCLYAHLLPLADGLRLQLLMRPLADGAWFRPGQGPENLLSEHDGKPVQAYRNLPEERSALQRVLQACPSLANAESDGQQWQLDQPQDALQMLSELHALSDDQLQCVWPEGERMRIKARRSLNQLRIDVQKHNDWFELQGELTLDDGKVLQLRQLLELLKASPGRFLKLDEHDWLALDARLRKRLDELAILADQISDKGLRFSPLAAPMIASLATEVDDFKADRNWQAQLEKLQSLHSLKPQLPDTLRAELRDYQREGFVWLSRLAHWGVGACLADDMGLGKTVQTLALLLQRANLGPQLVLAPTSVTLNWQAETTRFAPALKLRLYQQQRSLDDLGPSDLVIASYGLLQQDSAAFAACHWSSVVLDEAQAIKNAQTKRSQAVMALQADFRMVATGTPVENHLGELWNLFRFINPGLLGSQERFTQRFAGPIENGDAAVRRALKSLIQPFILRRLKSQVLEELPARTEITYKVPLSDDEAHQYEALRQQAVETLSQIDPASGKAMRVLAEITRLRRFCCHPSLVIPDSPLQGSKLQAFSEIITEPLENRHKVLVFSQFVDHLSIVRAWIERQGIPYQYLDGSTPAKERQNRVDAFQAGVGDIFLISLKAGGTGLNLTAADYVIHLDPWWNPAVEDQASDRAHRMGQSKPVTIYRLVAENSIEEQIVALHGRKRDLADSLLEGGEISAKLDADALLGLLKG